MHGRSSMLLKTCYFSSEMMKKNCLCHIVVTCIYVPRGQSIEKLLCVTLLFLEIMHFVLCEAFVGVVMLASCLLVLAVVAVLLDLEDTLS